MKSIPKVCQTSETLKIFCNQASVTFLVSCSWHFSIIAWKNAYCSNYLISLQEKNNLFLILRFRPHLHSILSQSILEQSAYTFLHLWYLTQSLQAIMTSINTTEFLLHCSIVALKWAKQWKSGRFREPPIPRSPNQDIFAQESWEFLPITGAGACI